MEHEIIRLKIQSAERPQLAAMRLIAEDDDIDDDLICEIMDVERLGDIPSRLGQVLHTDQWPPSVKNRALARARLGESPAAIAADMRIGRSTLAIWMRKAGVRQRRGRRKRGVPGV